MEAGSGLDLKAFLDSLELQHTIKKHNGNDFYASKYLNRFFDFSISQPSLVMNEFYNSLKVLIKCNVQGLCC